MAQVDFYILTSSGEFPRQQFACRLAEKAYRLNNTVHIHTGDESTVEKIDSLLWTFRDGSFVPHEKLVTSPTEATAPITIACEARPAGDCDLLINLSDEIPEIASSFPRVAEIVSSDSASKGLSRRRFVGYRESGHTLNTHQL